MKKNIQLLLLLRGLEMTGGVPGTNTVVLGEQIGWHWRYVVVPSQESVFPCVGVRWQGQQTRKICIPSLDRSDHSRVEVLWPAHKQVRVLRIPFTPLFFFFLMFLPQDGEYLHHLTNVFEKFDSVLGMLFLTLSQCSSIFSTHHEIKAIKSNLDVEHSWKKINASSERIDGLATQPRQRPCNQ